MKIVYLITGSGGSFYCGNCYRDMLFLRAIRKVKGIKASAIPLYLPPDKSNNDQDFDTRVFFGAISLYLREKVKFLKNMPAFLDKFFDMAPFLKLAARQAGTTRTEGLEDLTISMIEGDNAFRPSEVRRLANYLGTDGSPDIIHLSNALILGLARQLKKHMKVKVVCSLLNEDDWIDDMAEPFKSRAWEMIGKESEHVDMFVTPSTYYRDLFISKTGVPGEKISIVPLGFDPEAQCLEKRNEDRPPAIGFFSRVNKHNGFDKIVDAFIQIKQNEKFPGLTLNICGGYTGDDKPFLREQIKKIKDAGFGSYIRLYHEFHGEKKAQFFRDVDLISVPVNKYDGYGLYILESNCAGVPVVQPATGGFPEIIETTGGGIIYEPDDIESLTKAITGLLRDSSLRSDLGKLGSRNVREKLSLTKMSEGLEKLYRNTLLTS